MTKMRLPIDKLSLFLLTTQKIRRGQDYRLSHWTWNTGNRTLRVRDVKLWDVEQGAERNVLQQVSEEDGARTRTAWTDLGSARTKTARARAKEDAGSEDKDMPQAARELGKVNVTLCHRQ